MEKSAFLLSFLTLVWKKVYISALYYSDLKGIPLTGYVLLKSVKYHLFSDLGILKEIKPYFEKALENGFLMPNETRENKDVSEAILLFGEAYSIYYKFKDSKKKEELEKSFLLQHASNFSYEEEISKIPKEEFLETMEVWDVDIGLLETQDKIVKLFEISLFLIINSSSNSSKRA